MWDFGFLLLNVDGWKRAGRNSIGRREKRETVDSLLKRLVRVGAGDSQSGCIGVAPIRNKRKSVAWRDFFDACKQVANTERERTGQACRAFDTVTASPESLTCLVLEIWLSQILQDVHAFAGLLKSTALQRRNNNLRVAIKAWIDRAKKMLKKLSSASYRADKDNLVDLAEILGGSADFKDRREAMEDTIKKYPVLKEGGVYRRFALVSGTQGFSLQLYETWLLLLEVLDFQEYIDHEVPFESKRDRRPDPAAAACRHWYKTACLALEQAERDPDLKHAPTLIPVRLPGSFSIRGDWYLAVAQGSRSSRLADLALDLLSSRRANRTRLHLGMGLPVRDVLPSDQIKKLRTKLTVTVEGVRYEVLYGDLLELCGEYVTSEKGTSPRDKFRWAFRSGFRDYDRQAIAIRRWLHRTFVWTVRYRFEQAHNWEGGFAAYDRLQMGDIDCLKDFESYNVFMSGIRTFVEDLYACSPEAV